MENPEIAIAKTFLEKYKENLAAILIFGSYFTGQYKSGISDIDLIVLFKNPLRNAIKEQESLTNKLKSLNVFIHHFKSLKEYKHSIYEKASWSSWIVVQSGSKAIYSTPEFQSFKTYLSTHKLDNNKLTKFILEKDTFDLQIDLAKKSGWGATKMLYAHIRRKLQILNFYQNNNLEFDFSKCLNSINTKNKAQLNKLSDLYNNRRNLTKKETQVYVKTSKSLTSFVIKSLSSNNQKV